MVVGWSSLGLGKVADGSHGSSWIDTSHDMFFLSSDMGEYALPIILCMMSINSTGFPPLSR